MVGAVGNGYGVQIGGLALATVAVRLVILLLFFLPVLTFLG